MGAAAEGWEWRRTLPPARPPPPPPPPPSRTLQTAVTCTPKWKRLRRYERRRREPAALHTNPACTAPLRIEGCRSRANGTPALKGLRGAAEAAADRPRGGRKGRAVCLYEARRGAAQIALSSTGPPRAAVGLRVSLPGLLPRTVPRRSPPTPPAVTPEAQLNSAGYRGLRTTGCTILPPV
ncbi:uncharacterized protein LOC126424552 [Schistocerca serialis cubense]|uniref:uncharacterized protein LOC126424552 n=1 Tax=Schistocerca serialis cubense TaxID=2023355 RepID=UPI00214E492D|nr:uncharacterized protein LOC126424552 [Schistocerca serialis cubense]